VQAWQLHSLGDSHQESTMRAIAVCFLALLGLGCSIPADKREIAALRKQNSEFQQKLDGIEMHEKCAKLAEHSFNTMPKPAGANYDYTCHYNKRLNKFFISITIFDYKSMVTTKMIVDLLENKTIASYGWKPDKVKKYWDVKPFYCEINGEHKNWTTEDYDAFEKSSMAD
jgi:hypothetical protein